MHIDHAIRLFGSVECFCRRPGHGGRSTKQPQNRRALRSSKTALSTKDIVGSDPPLSVGRTSQRNLRRCFQDKILHFNRIADGKDIRIVGLQELVDLNPTPLTHF